MDKTKQCSRCNQVKSLDEFKSDQRKPDGKASSCKACNSVPRVGSAQPVQTLELIPAPDPHDPQTWITRISNRWRDSVEAIFDVGRMLHEAKANLAYGLFGTLIESQLPFGARTAQRLMAIAADKRLTDPTHVSHLPASWGTLYELSQLSDDEFEKAIEENIIRPDMLRGDAEMIRPLTRTQESQAKEPEANPGSEVTTSGLPGLGSSRPYGGRSPSATSEIMDATAGGTAPDSSPMPSGGLAIAHRRVENVDSLDYFPTPPWATRALIEHVLGHMERRGHCKWQSVWEPACGEGHMAEVLREYYRDVTATDIHGRSADYQVQDFLQDVTRPDQQGFDWIITNPPFNESADFVLKAIRLAGTGVAMFVRLAWLESVGRYERIFRDYPPTQLAIFPERVPLHKGRWEADGSTMTAYIWLVWIKGAEPRAPFWIPPGCREALTRPDDAKRFGKSLPPHDPITGEILENEGQAA